MCCVGCRMYMFSVEGNSGFTASLHGCMKEYMYGLLHSLKYVWKTLGEQLALWLGTKWDTHWPGQSTWSTPGPALNSSFQLLHTPASNKWRFKLVGSLALIGETQIKFLAPDFGLVLAGMAFRKWSCEYEIFLCFYFSLCLSKNKLTIFLKIKIHSHSRDWKSKSSVSWGDTGGKKEASIFFFIENPLFYFQEVLDKSFHLLEHELSYLWTVIILKMEMK